jgi:TonB-dependent starch-binding outer membrane protein SusC
MKMKKIYRSLPRVTSVLLFLFTTVLAYSQNEQVVTGTVRDDQGSPMPGVNVVIKGTTNGSTTDGDGAFSIQAKPDAILVVSFIGYTTQEVAVGNRTKIDVSLKEDVATLQEVVVVGYGEMKRSDLSSAQVSVTSDQISKTVNTTFEQALQGRAAGVYVTQNTGQPGGGVSVNIRGVSTLNGSNEPLYVIDGVQIAPGTVSYGSTSSTNPLAAINPRDIESMEVLQGPSATAIYGSRGTNGVVLITTKRGKAGETKVNYSLTYAVQDKPKALPVMNLRQYATMTNEISNVLGWTPPEAFKDPSLLGVGTNWQEELFKTAPLVQHQLSLSGGSDKTTFYLSAEIFDNDGVAQGSHFGRNSIRLNIDNQTRKWLKLGANLNVVQTKDRLSSTSENVILNALSLSPNIPVKNPDGSWGGADATNGSSVQFTPLNPIAISNLVQNTLRRRTVLGGMNAEVTLLKGLVFRTSLNGNIAFSNSHVFTPTWQLGDKRNDVASLNDGSGLSTNWNWNQLLQYNTKIGKHDIGVMVSHEAQESKWEGINGGRNNFVSNDLPVLPIGDGVSATNGGYKGHWAMESLFGRVNYTFKDRYILQAGVRADGSSNFGPNNRWGVFPSASVGWRISEEPFFANVEPINELKIRYETGLTGNQGNGGIYGPLSSVTTPYGTGFLLGKYPNDNLQWEETLTHNVGLNISFFENRIQLEADFFLKKTDNLLMNNPLPAYMAVEGEGAISPPTVNIGAMENRGYAISMKTINMDRNGFKWETGFNVSGFKTEVTEFYSDAAVIPRTSWYMNNWTQMAVIGRSPWLFYGYIEEGIFETVDEINNSAIPADNNGNRRAVSPGSVWVGDVKYKDKLTVDTDGDGKADSGDGIIDDRDQTYIGNPWPKVTFGMSNKFSFKGFDLDILLTGAYGNDVYNYLRFQNTNPNNINLGRNLLRETFQYARIEGTGDDAHVVNTGTRIPRISGSDVNGNGARFTQKFVEDGSYVRVKSIQLGYSVPKSLISKQNVVQNVRLGVAVQNIYTFTKYKGYDPEVGAYVGRDVDSNNQPIGVDYGRYPLTPVYTFNLSVDF